MTDEIVRDIFVRSRGLTVQIDYIQGTNAVPLRFQFRDYTVPTGAAARIYIKKPSGKEVYNNASLSENTVTVQPTSQMFAEAGEQEGQLQLTSGQKILVTFPILFRVERNLISESAVESTDEYGALLQLIQDAGNAVLEANSAAKKANTAAGEANTAAGSASEAACTASEAAGEANTAAGNANTAAGEANRAATAANQSKENADAAAKRANDAAKLCEDITSGLGLTEILNRIEKIETAISETLATE